MCSLQLNHFGLSYLGWKGILEKEEISVFPLAGYLANGSNTEDGIANGLPDGLI